MIDQKIAGGIDRQVVKAKVGDEAEIIDLRFKFFKSGISSIKVGEHLMNVMFLDSMDGGNDFEMGDKVSKLFSDGGAVLIRFESCQR